MKGLFLSLVLVFGLSSSSYAKEPISKADASTYARCSFLAKALKKDQKIVKRYIKAARSQLDTDDMNFEAGWAAGFVSGLQRYDHKKSKKQVAELVFKHTCTLQEV